MHSSSASISSARLRRSCPPSEVGHFLGPTRSRRAGPGAPPGGRRRRHRWQNIGEFEVGGLQQLVQPVAFGGLVLHQLAAVAQQLAQIALRLRRHEAFGDQAMADQIGDPLCILHIGLAAGHVADVQRIDDDQVELSLQYSIGRPPVDHCARHPDMGHARLRKPALQRHENRGSWPQTSAPPWSAAPRRVDSPPPRQARDQAKNRMRQRIVEVRCGSGGRSHHDRGHWMSVIGIVPICFRIRRRSTSAAARKDGRTKMRAALTTTHRPLNLSPGEAHRLAVCSERAFSADIHQSWPSYIAFGCSSRNLIATVPFCASSLMTYVPPRPGTNSQA
jgi:hypothetical protein